MSFLPRITLFRAEGLVPVLKTGCGKLDSTIRRGGAWFDGIIYCYVSLCKYRVSPPAFASDK